MFTRFLKSVKRYLPTILTVTGCAGIIGTAIASAKNTMSADEVIEKYEYETGLITSTKQLVHITWKCYIPTMIFVGSSIGCVVTARVIDSKRIAALALSSAASSAALTKWKMATKKVLGEEALNDISEELANEDIEKAGSVNIYDSASGEVITPADEDGAQRFYDIYSGRWFEAKLSSVLASMYHLNRNLHFRDAIEVNDFYYMLGISPDDRYDGMGWDMSTILEQYGIEWIDISCSKVKNGDYYTVNFVTTPWPIYDWIDPIYPHE